MQKRINKQCTKLRKELSKEIESDNFCKCKIGNMFTILKISAPKIILHFGCTNIIFTTFTIQYTVKRESVIAQTIRLNIYRSIDRWRHCRLILFLRKQAPICSTIVLFRALNS